ncbi:hypothetical protein HN873_052640, partial [Arachis hypogaea]
LPPSLSESPTSNHSLCSQPYKCGEQELYYPFWGKDKDRPRQCGGDEKLELFCGVENDDKRPYTYIEMGSQRFNVVGNDNPQNNYYWVKMVPLPLAEGGFDVCSGNTGYAVDYPLLMYNQTMHNITIFYTCNYTYPDNHNLGCSDSRGGVDVYYNGTEKEVLESHPDLQYSC